jgi:hypothetical protein
MSPGPPRPHTAVPKPSLRAQDGTPGEIVDRSPLQSSGDEAPNLHKAHRSPDSAAPRVFRGHGRPAMARHGKEPSAVPADHRQHVTWYLRQESRSSSQVQAGQGASAGSSLAPMKIPHESRGLFHLVCPLGSGVAPGHRELSQASRGGGSKTPSLARGVDLLPIPPSCRGPQERRAESAWA